jgi:hypothetical protein
MAKDLVDNHLNGSIEVYNKDLKYNNKIRKGIVFKLKIPMLS